MERNESGFRAFHKSRQRCWVPSSPKKQAKTKGSEQSIETGKESGIRAFHKEQRREEFQGSEQRGNRVSSINATRNLGYAANTCEFRAVEII